MRFLRKSSDGGEILLSGQNDGSALLLSGSFIIDVISVLHVTGELIHAATDTIAIQATNEIAESVTLDCVIGIQSVNISKVTDDETKGTSSIPIQVAEDNP